MPSGRVTFTDYDFGFTPTNPPVNTFYPGVIVGSDPWDDNLATYTEATISERDEGTYADGQQARMVAPAGMGTLIGWSLEVDIAATNIGGSGSAFRWSFAVYDFPGASYIDEWDFGSPTQAMSTDALHTETGVGFYGGMSLATLEAAINEGWWISSRRLTNPGIYSPPADYKLLISRVNLTVTWDEICSSIIRPTGSFTNQNFDPATVIGAQPVLADDNDATYVKSLEGQFPYEFGLESLTSYDTISNITLHTRLSVTGGGSPVDAHGEVFLATSGGVGNSADEFAGFSDGTTSGFGFDIPTVDGTILDLAIPLSLGAWGTNSPYNPGGPTTEADVVAALEAGAFLDFNFIQNSNADTPPIIRVYEAWIEYEHTCVEEEPGQMSVIRQYPRDDEEGWGSGTRFYPPPKANRTIGRIQ